MAATDITRPGGLYLNPDGKTFHDAHGRAVDARGTLLAGDQIPGAVNAQDDEAWRAEMAKQREVSAAGGVEVSDVADVSDVPSPRKRK